MSVEITVKGERWRINTEVIDRDIILMEETKGALSPTGIPPALRCFRDQRHYDPDEIASTCIGVCPHYKIRFDADDTLLLHDCERRLFKGTSSDGKTPYIAYMTEKPQPL
jgi:hypothetical protein